MCKKKTFTSLALLAIFAITASFHINSAAADTGQSFVIDKLPQRAAESARINGIDPMKLIELLNADRAANGLKPLAFNIKLGYSAYMKAKDMADKSYFSHNSPEGVTPWHWFKEAGYTYSNAGENLAVNFDDSESIERAWMDSPGHRANILSGKYNEIGIAAVKGVYKGKETVFVVQHFGTVMPAAFVPIAKAAKTVKKPAAAGKAKAVLTKKSTVVKKAVRKTT